MKIVSPPITKSEQPVEESKPKTRGETSEEDRESTEEETTPTAVAREVMKIVPKIYKVDATQRLDKIKENRDLLHWNEKGELMYENKLIPGSLNSQLLIGGERVTWHGAQLTNSLRRAKLINSLGKQQLQLSTRT